MEILIYYRFSNHQKDFTFEQLSSFIMTFIKNPNELKYYEGNPSIFKALNQKCDDQIEKIKTKEEL